jgi:hypothetical protein
MMAVGVAPSSTLPPKAKAHTLPVLSRESDANALGTFVLPMLAEGLNIRYLAFNVEKKPLPEKPSMTWRRGGWPSRTR